MINDLKKNILIMQCREHKMKIKLIRYDEENNVAKAARLCYFKFSIDELNEEMTNEKCAKLISNLKRRKHDSPFEHVSYTFGIEGISRACSHQLVRHRIASYNQQSQRYVKEEDYQYILPPSIKDFTPEMDIYVQTMLDIQKAYNKLISLGINKEDARYMLPNSCETKIIMTINARSLKNLFDLRRKPDAQWEIRYLADEMYKQVKQIHPNIWSEEK